MTAQPLSRRAAELRRDFDRAFAEPPRERRAVRIDLLAIRLGGQPYALRLTDIAGLFADKTRTRLPEAVPEFLGVAGFRGSVVPVYDLGALLGHGASRSPRWLAMAAAGPVALAFDALDAYWRVPPQSIARQDPSLSAQPHVHELVRAADAGAAEPVRPLLDIDSVLGAVRRCARLHPAFPSRPQE